MRLAYVYAVQGRSDDAIRALRRAVALADTPTARAQLSRALRARGGELAAAGQAGEAAALLAEAARVAPATAPAGAAR
jgi:tetratricopeptide (TPR) repeat protein